MSGQSTDSPWWMLQGCWFSSIAQSMFCRLVSLNVKDIFLNSRCFQGRLVCERFPSSKCTSWVLLQYTAWSSPEHSPGTPTSRDQMADPSDLWHKTQNSNERTWIRRAWILRPCCRKQSIRMFEAVCPTLGLPESFGKSTEDSVESLAESHCFRAKEGQTK